jgi:hypothetical protein
VKTIDDVDPIANFSTIIRMTEREALVGKIDTITGFKLAFHASQELAAAWSDAEIGAA